MARAAVGEHVGQEGGADALRASLQQDPLLLEEQREPAGGAAEDDPDIVTQPVALEAGVGKRLLRRDHAQLSVAVHAAQLLGLDPSAGVESLDLARDLDRKLPGVEEGHQAHTGLALEEGGPGAGRVQADGGHGADPGDDDAPHGAGVGAARVRAISPSLRLTTATSWLIRRISPESTWPGPISRKAALPRATISTTELVHWTGRRM